MNKKYLTITGSGIVILSILFFTGKENIGKLGISLFFFFLYIVLLWDMNKKSRTYILRLGGLLLIAIEMIVVNYDSINSRGVKTKSTLQGNASYEDGTKRALEYLKEIDDQEFYRIDKQYTSVLLSDAIAQNYYGISSYVGFTENNNAIGEFYDSLGLPKKMGYHFLYPVSINNEINSLLGVKYILSKGEIANFGYNKVTQINDINIYENMYSLPLGVVYDNFILKSDFEKLSYEEKKNTIIHACVLEKSYDSLEQSYGEKLEKFQQITYSEVMNNETLSSKIQFDIPACTLDETIILRFNINSLDDCTGKLTYQGDAVLSTTYDLAAAKGKHEYAYEVNTENVDEIILKFPNTCDIEEASIYKVNKRQYHQNYVEGLNNLKENKLTIQTFDDMEIQGIVNSKQDGMLFFAIPYDDNWQCFINGEKVELGKVNIGFLGVEVEKGEHDVRLLYNTKMQSQRYYGIFFCGIFICTISFFISWRYKRRKADKK